MTRKPAWLRTTVPAGEGFRRLNARLAAHGINTVCTSARCPNLHDCWNHGTATLMILGNTCTRRCRFCSVQTGNPNGAVDAGEPGRVGAAVRELGLGYVVLTSVDRDDLDDLGAGIFARALAEIRGQASGGKGPQVEVLVPDFGGREELIRLVVEAGPEVYGHNVETVRRLTPEVRDRRASYDTSLAVLATVKRLAPGLATKSGLMVGLGETDADVEAAMQDLAAAGCDILTIGQYLQPDRRCRPVDRYVEPARFDEWQYRAKELGFRSAACGPLVRSSYHAAELFESL